MKKQPYALETRSADGIFGDLLHKLKKCEKVFLPGKHVLPLACIYLPPAKGCRVFIRRESKILMTLIYITSGIGKWEVEGVVVGKKN